MLPEKLKKETNSIWLYKTDLVLIYKYSLIPEWNDDVALQIAWTNLLCNFEYWLGDYMSGM